MTCCKKVRDRMGASLLEVICVMVVIVIVIAIIKMCFSYRHDTIKINIARQELALLNCALETFRTKKGYYPVATSKVVDDNCETLYKNLSELLKTTGMKHMWSVKNNKLLDPWEHPYIYRCESQGALQYILFSMGPNGYIDEDELIDDMHSR